MKANITEYLRINLDSQMWECRRCDAPLIAADENYKRGLLIYDRDPREVHPPLLDTEKYSYSFSPDPAYTALLEYYCPHCGTMVETEYTVPGHPPVRDIELDLESLRNKVLEWGDTSHAPDIPEVEVPRHVHRH